MSKLTIEEILCIEGIVVRLIPKTLTSRYSVRKGRTIKGEIITDESGRQWDEVTRELSLGGKYIIHYVSGQGSSVYFNKRHSGIGNTIQEAFADFVEKGFNYAPSVS